jgi:hypothetical protein
MGWESSRLQNHWCSSGRRPPSGLAVVTRPPILQGFESRALRRLEATLNALPKGKATLYWGADPTSPAKALFPYFRITPANANSGSIRGFLVEGQGFDYTIGQATGGEIFVGPTDSPQMRANEDRFFEICQAVFKSQFTELLTYNSRGRVIRSRISLRLGGRTVRLGGQQLFWWLVPGRVTKVFSYEPY